MSRLKSTLAKAMRGLDADIEPSKTDQEQATMGDGEADDALAEVKKNRKLTEVMTGTVDTLSVYEVDPKRCKPWSLHNRLYDLLNEDFCADLITSIRSNGQIEPAIVRKLPYDEEYDYEIICGARRHWVAVYLKRKLKIEVRELNDEDAFLLSNASNIGKDISEYERALEYKDALDRYYDGNQKKMAARLDITTAQLSRYMALANLDPIIVTAYPDPREISISHAEKIRKLWKNPAARNSLQVRAEELKQLIKEERAPKDGKEILKALLKPIERVPRAPASGRTVNAKETGKRMFTIRRERTGHVVLRVDPDSGASAAEILTAIKKYMEAELQNQ